MHCEVCGLNFVNPLPVPENLSDHYGVPPENYWNADYFKADENYFKGEINTLKNHMTIEKGMKALDIGAGIGKAMIALNKAGFDTYGIEPSLPFYERAISAMNISPARLQHAKAEEVSFPENYFDFITFGAVLEHLYDPSKAILDALYCLKPGGLIQIEVPSSGWLIGKLINLYYKLRGTDYVGNLSPMHEPFHLYEFSLNTFRLHGQKYGYEVTHHDHYVCQTYLPAIADLILKPLMQYSQTGMQLCVWLRKKN